MLKLGVMLASLAVLAAGAPPARALQAQVFTVQFFGQPDDDPEPVPPPPGVDPADWDDAPPPPTARVCRKMCANDFSPCDPIYYKTEDGRCDGLDIGR